MYGLILAVLLQSHAAGPVATLSGWAIYDNRGTCAAVTRYGASGDVMVAVDYDHGANIVLFTVTKPAWESIQAGTSYPVELRFSNGETYPETQALGVRLDDANVRMTGISLRLDGRDFLSDFAASASVLLQMGHVRLEALNLRGTRAVMRRLVTCSISSWRRYPPDPFAGRGRVSTARTSPPPPSRLIPPQRARANMNNYFSTDDYPAAALREQHQGTTGVSLTISAAGRVSDCRVTSSSGSAALDEATCRILRSRARYTPARDVGGNPTTGTDSSRITWRLPAQ